MDDKYWKDHKGRKVEIQSMSDKWLNNIRKKVKNKDLKKPIIKEIERRGRKRNMRKNNTYAEHQRKNHQQV